MARKEEVTKALDGDPGLGKSLISPRTSRRAARCTTARRDSRSRGPSSR